MSLQLAAQHLASRGRGPDTTLVHMAPQEVAGLQAIAKAHGGSLTVNPDTGLAEAGFLSSILPMVAGAALAATGVGAPMAAMMIGGGMTVATGSLQKGLMAGLGAYGGAGLAGGLLGAGSAAGLGAAAGEAGLAGTAAADATLAQANAANAAMAGTESAANAAASATPEFAALNATPTQFGAFGEPIGSFVPPTQAGSIVPTTVAMPELSAVSANQVSVQQMLEAGFTPKQIAESAGEYAADTAGTAASPFSAATQKAMSSPLSAGFDAFKANPSQFMTKENLKYGLAGLAPVAMDMMTPKQRAEEEKRKAYEYTYSPGRVADPQQGYTGAFTGERTYFNPTYTRTAASGGLMDIGPVEAMAQVNQSQMQPAYARGGVSDIAVNPYTGAETFAEGGETKAVKPVEQDPYYTMSGQSGDAFKYLMGQQPVAPRAAAAAPAANSTGATGFLKGITGFASPAGTVDITTGQLTPWSASNPKPAGGGFFGGQGTPVEVPSGARFGAPFSLGQAASSAAQDAGGEYVDDTSGLLKAYDFDPVTGMMTPKALPKVFRPYAPVTSMGSDVGGTGGNANGGLLSLAQGGQSHLGDYSDGGRLLRGPGDGVSDDIPATIGDKRPARLADGEFVVPARIVSELGNGSTEAGARKLYAMMDRVQKARAKTTGKDRVATNTKAERLLPV